MQAYQFERSVPASHTITVELPADAPTGLAQVIVLFPEARDTPSQPTPPQFASIAAYLAWHDTQPASGRSPEDANRQIREERESCMAEASNGHIEVINIGEPHGTNT